MKTIRKITASLCILFLLATVVWPVSAAQPENPVNATEKAKPVLQILGTETHRIYSQKENTITFSLNNTSRFTANEVRISPDITAEKAVSGVRILSTLLEPANQVIGPDAAREYQIRVVADESAKEGIYPIYLNITYKNNAGDPFQTTLLLYYEVRKDETKLEKVEITDDNFSALKPEADKELTFQYKIKNDTDYQVRNVKTKIEGLPAEFTLKSASDTVTIGNIMPLIAKPAEFTYYLKADIAAGSYPFTVTYEYENRDGQRIVRQAKYNVFISPSETGKATGKLTYSGFSYPNSVAQDQAFPISFKITNTGDKDIKELSVKMADNNVFLPKTPSVVKFDDLKQGESQTYSVTVIGTGDSLKDRNYPITFEISYKTSTAKDAQTITDTQVIGVYLDAKEEEKDKEKNLPKIILDSYKLEPTIVQASQQFELNMVFKNTNRTKDIYNVKAFLTFDIATGRDTVQQNVFSPVNSSNTFYIDHIGPNQTVSRTFTMYVVPDAAPKTYMVNVNFEYEDKDGKAITAKELVGIPVMQTTKVETSELTLPTSATLNQEVSANFNIYNTGKAKVYNVMINVEGNGFTADPNNQYIGSFDVGQSNSYEGYLRFSEPGEQKGKFIVSYDDQNGEKFTIEKEFNIMVEEEPMMPDMDPNMPGMDGDGMMPDQTAQGGLPWGMIIGGVVGVLVVAGIVIGILRKRKHKKEMNSYEEK